MRYKAGFRAAAAATLLALAAALAAAILFPPSPSTGAADAGYITDVDGNDEEGGTYASTQANDNVFEAAGETSNVNRAYSYINLQYNVSGLNVTADKITMMEFSARYCHSGMDAYAANMCTADAVEHAFNGAQDVFVWNAAPGGTWVDIGDLSTTNGGVEVLGGWNATGTLSNYVNATTGYVTVRYEIQTNAPGANFMDAWLAIDYATLRVKYNGSALTVWDDTDPQAGSLTAYAYDNVTFYANYTNATGYPVNATNDPAVNCSINVYNVTAWTGWRTMDYSAAGLYRYNMTDGFAANGTYAWNVSCMSRNHQNRTENNTIPISIRTTNLTIWDDTDPQAGSRILYALDDANFWANYTNGSGYPINATVEATVNCSINVYNVTAWTGWRPMSYNATSRIYQYAMDNGFQENGTYPWNVTCSARGYQNRTGNDTITISRYTETRLSVWDSADPAGGSMPLEAFDNVTFWANYTNVTGQPVDATLDPQVNCSINVYNVTAWTGWLPMTYSAATRLYHYNMTGGFDSNGTWGWNVSCTSGIYDNKTANTTAYILPPLASNLTIWDLTDAAGGNRQIYRRRNVTFFANYTNTTGYPVNATLSPGAACSINVLNVTSWTGWLPMTYNATSRLYQYDMAGGFSTNGTWQWNVSCQAKGYGTKTANDTVYVRPPEPSNLSIWDATDPAGGSLLLQADDNATFWANYSLDYPVSAPSGGYVTDLDGDDEGGTYTDAQADDGNYYVVGETTWFDNAHSYIVLEYDMSGLGIDSDLITSLYFSARYCHSGGNNPASAVCDGSDPIEQTFNGAQNVEVYNFATSAWTDIGDLSTTDNNNEVAGGWSAAGTLSDYVNSSNIVSVRYELYTNAPLNEDAWLVIDYAGLEVEYGNDDLNCSANIFNVTGWTGWRAMTYNATSRLHRYDMAEGFSANGTYPWNVTCSGGIFQEQARNDTVYIRPPWPTNLTVWDDTDPAGGSKTIRPYDNATFFANYTNTSGYPINATVDPTANCSINVYNVSSWTGWRPMTYSPATRLYHYNMTGGFETDGAWQWNVSCQSKRYGNRTGNDTIVVSKLPSNLTVWDMGDPQAGSQTVFTYDNTTFWANYTNSSGYPINATVDSMANCSINLYNVTAWTGWRPMTYSTASRLYTYNMTGGFAGNGTWSWNVSCMSQRYDNQTRNTTIAVQLRLTNLTIWDDTDPAGGNRLVWAGENLTFWANYTNTTGYPVNSTTDPTVNCSVNILNVTAWTGWRPMTYSPANRLYHYNMTGGFSANGTWTWNVSCNARTYQNWTRNDTAYIRPPEATILAIWDGTDPAGGGSLLWAGENVSFWANYTNATGYPVNATLDATANCSINVYNVTAWTGWRPMAYNASSGLYQYPMTGGFSLKGAWQWNVSCMARRYENKTGNDTVAVKARANLTVWDDTDPAGGSLAVYSGEDVSFWADYKNATGYPVNATIDPAVNCSVNVYNATAWTGWLPMSYDGGSGLYRYLMAGGFPSTGVWQWNVSCGGLEHENRTGNDTVYIMSRTELGIWDESDPEAGVVNIDPYEPASFWANYTNATGYPMNATLDADAECRVRIYNVTGWTGWITMTYAPATGLYKYNMTGGFNMSGLYGWNVSCTAGFYQNRTASDTIRIGVCANDSQCGGNECCNGICQPPAQNCCGRDGCEAGEDYLGCQADCCEGDCSGEADGLCRSECAGYNGCGTVSAECVGLAADSCADAESDCVVCEHRPCQDFACAASCYGNRWRSAPPVDNTCSAGSCSEDECAWEYTCDSGLAMACGTWQCDGDDNCAGDSVCSSSCRCLKRDVTVNSTTYLVIQEPWDFRDWVWFARG